MRPTAERRAFTLVELLIVIGIMAFMLTISIIGFAPMFRQTSIDKAREILRAGLESARIRAIQQRRQVRFEARAVENSTTHTWRFAPNAGDYSPDWKQLPDFVVVETNAGNSPDSGNPRLPVANYRDVDDVASISLTFAVDGSLRRYMLRDANDAPVAEGDIQDAATPIEPFALRLSDKRDTGGAPAVRFIVVYPLTGALRSYRTLDQED
jgi:prepilin-type N-terminal cleavage/methylation domain-containing protein